jgi:hypothetical protein
MVAQKKRSGRKYKHVFNKGAADTEAQPLLYFSGTAASIILKEYGVFAMHRGLPPKNIKAPAAPVHLKNLLEN